MVVNYRSDEAAAREACREAEARGAPRALAVRADVAEPAEGCALLSQVLAAFGRIDVWVNNAGVAPAARRDLLETTPESWDRALGINLRGPFFLTQAVARSLVELVASGTVRDPQIVFVTSVSSTFASVTRADYFLHFQGGPEHGRAALCRTGWQKQGILVYEVRPGIIATDMTGPVHAEYDRRINAGLALHDPAARGLPSDVGRAPVSRRLAASALPFSTGEVIHVDGGLHLRRL